MPPSIHLSDFCTHEDLMLLLDEAGACQKARRWAEKNRYTPAEAWDACKDPDWLVFAIDRLHLPGAEDRVAEYEKRYPNRFYGRHRYLLYGGHEDLPKELQRKACDDLRRLFPNPFRE